MEFLDHGVLTLLKNWLEPLPDGSLPNINIRTAILKILNDVLSFHHYKYFRCNYLLPDYVAPDSLGMFFSFLLT